MKISVAEKSGFCFGVTRAAKLLEEQLNRKTNPVFTFGPLIHNDQFNARMKGQGAKIVNSVDEVEDGSIIISRAHGLEKSIIKELNNKDIELIDGVCPFVKLVHKKALELENQGYQVIIIGERKHAEVKAAASYIKNPIIIEKVKEVNELDIKGKIGVVVQTTQSQKNVDEVVSALENKFGKENVKLENTRCLATEERQNAAMDLAKKVDMMIIIGGRESANTNRLYELCSELILSHHIETAEELSQIDFTGINLVGVTAGASAPQYIIDEVIEKLKTF
ncbi:MAG: 4-hydroxy-3-methylbut-2-enyl diphosphate reductase [Candidatus Micrarchaeia archaeon]|jgi:4-hydroxy-3-methylbut-2-enyl diphosphate reductase